MKKYLVLAMALILAGCASCTKEDEDFGPYPNREEAKSAKRQSN